MNKNTYLFKGFLSFLLILGYSFADAQTYCASSPVYNNDSHIAELKLVGSSVTLSTVSPTGCATYTDNTSLTPADLSADADYSIELTYGSCG